MVGLVRDYDLDENAVVISGMSGRFPLSRNVSEFEENLFSGKQLVTPKEDHIWVNNTFDVPNFVGQIYDKSKFDFSFFGFPLKLAEAHDPAVRIALEVAYEAVTDAGLDIDEIRGKNGAVIMTSHIVDTEHLFVTTTIKNGMLGHSRTMLANRISYWMNLTGPSYTFFSMDAGGVEALTKGYNAIKSGQCELAIIGSGTTILMPHLSQHYCLLKHLSEDGQCRSFDAQGSGYARSECVTVFLLQKAKHAKRIYASIVDSDTVMYGFRESPLAIPRGIQYADLLQELYDRCGVDPNLVSYLEAEGNALKHMEEEEMKALEKVFLKDRRSPLLIGSVKSNMGHGDAGANHCSLVKLLIAFQKGLIPPNINFNQPAPYIAKHVAEGKLQVVTEETPLDGEYVGISTVELTGKAGHTLIRKFGKEKPEDTHKDKLPRLVLLSSRTEDGIKKWLDDVEAMPVDTEYIGLVHEAFNSNNPNNFLKGYTIVPQTQKKLTSVQYFNGTRHPIWLIFSGMGSQWPGMGEDLMKLPICAAAIENCHAVLAEKGLDLKHIITSKDPAIFDNILHCFVGIAAIQIALVDVLTAVGIKPDGIVGHSVGELGCAYSDGCFTQEQMILAAYYRGLASLQTELIPGSMAAVGLGYKEVVGMLPETIDVACHNSASSSTLSGPAKDVQQFVEELKAKKIFARAVNVANIAYHSRYIKPAAPALLDFLKKVVPEPKKRSSLWICSSVPEDRWSTPLAEYASAEYFTNNLLSPVLFEEASKYIPKDAITIEVAPHGLLQAILRRSLGPDCINIPLTQRGADDNLRFMLAALGNVYVVGTPLKVQALYAPVQFPVSRGTRSISPNITWEHSVTLSEIYFSMKKNVSPEITLSVNNENERVYVHHVLNGSILLPSFAVLKIIWENMAGLHMTSFDKLPVVFENVRFLQHLELPERRSVKVESLIQKGSGNFEMSSNGVILVCGKISVLENATEETGAQVAAIKSKSVLTAEDIYLEFDRRGHQYGKPFQGIKQAAVCNQGCIAKVEWSDNWVTFVDSLFQVIMLHTEEESACVQQPFTIQKLVLDPHLLANSQQDVEVNYHAPTSTLSSTAVKIHNMKTVTIPKRPYEFTLSKIQFLSHCLKNKSVGVKEFTEMGVQIVEENSCNSSKVAVAILTAEEAEDETTSMIKAVFDSDPNVTWMEVPLASSKIIATQDKTTYALIVSTNVNLQQESLRLLAHTNGFLMLRLSLNQALNLSHNVLVVAELCTNKERLLLLKKVYSPDNNKCSILQLGGEISSWLNQIKYVEPTERLYAVWQASQEELNLALYSMKKFLEIPSLEHVRFIFIADKKAPRFSLDNEMYWKHIQQDLRVNIYLSGTWGSFYQVGITAEKQAPYHLYLNSILNKNINYLAVNLQDAEHANVKSLLQKQGIQEFGTLDFSGLSATGQHIMGVAKLDSKSNKIVSDEYLTWNLPKSWSLEDGATVPLAYAMAYYALHITAGIQQQQVVLIHSGGSTVGQACISLALHKNCTVFTTVSSETHKKYLREKFPQLNSENICGTGSAEFQVKVLRATKGSGAHIIVNTLAGSLLNASWKCLGWNGYFIQIGKNALVNNNSIGMYQFLKCVHFTGLLAENLLSIPVDVKKELHSVVQEGIANGVVQPLKRCTFSKKQLDEALSTMTDQSNVNKVVIAVREEHVAAEKKLFISDPQSCYLVTGSKYQQCMDVAEWLVRRGALHVVLATSCKSVSNETLRRIEILQHHYGSKVHLLDVPEVSTAQRASKLLKEAERLTNRRLAGLFILPSECSSCNLDMASREVTYLKHFVCLMMENSWRVCEKRRKEGVPALAVHWSNSETDEFRLLTSLSALDQLLTVDVQDAVLIVKQHIQLKQTKDMATFMVTDLLPSCLEEVAEFGEQLATAESQSWLVELPSRCRGLAHTKNLPVVVMVPGTQSSPQHFLKPLARKLINPTVCVKLPRSDINLEEAAARIAQEIEKLQSDFTYHLIGVSNGGLLALHVAQCLERNGADVSVILLDGAPETMQLKAKQLGEGSVAQNKLISILLNINDDKVYDELSQRSTLPSKMKFALTQLSHDMQARREHIEAAVSTIYSIFDNLVQHIPTETLLKGKARLIRPGGSEADDNCGLSQFFKHTVAVHTVKAAHQEMFSCDETATIINEHTY